MEITATRIALFTKKMMFKQLKVGFIACSSIAERRFLPAVAELEALKIWRIGSRNVDKAKNVAEIFGASYFGTYEDVINDKSIDLVYISTPPHNHFELTKAALTAGKHVICEKPIANDLVRLISLHELASKNKLLFAEHYSFLYHPQHAAVKKLIRSGSIGEIQKFLGYYQYPMPELKDIRLNPDINGGVCHDSLGYPILAGLFFSEEKTKSITSRIIIDNDLKVDTSCSFNIKLEDLEISGEVAMGKEYASTYRLIGSKGSIKVTRAYSVNEDYEPEILVIINNDMSRHNAAKGSQIKEFMKAFISNINENLNRTEYKNNFYDNSFRLRSIQDQIMKNSNKVSKI